MKKPYIKKLGIFSGFNVWIVDGEYIRKNLDEEFTNFGQPLDFTFIPKNELWIDKEYSGNESRFFISHMLAEYRLMSEGKNFEQARKYANRIERRERAKSKIIKKALKKMKHKKEILNKIHKKLIKKYSKKIKVWIVRGELVRDLFFLDFTEGGHDLVYSFIPKGEIWIDDDVSQKERKFILLHEVHERNLMIKGWSYWPYKNPKKSAHKSASELEYFCRKYPKFLDKKLKEEFSKII